MKNKITPVSSLVKAARDFLVEFNECSHLLELFPDQLAEAHKNLAEEMERWP